MFVSLFGYVKAWKPELRIGEFEAYKSVYCGLCKDMGRRFGFWARFTLSYDFTFLALLGLSLEEQDPAITPGRCIFNPLRKINCCHSGEPLTFAGDVAMLLLWHKLEDNREDGGFTQRVVAGAAMLLVQRAYRRAAASRPALAELMRTAMAEQGALEKAGCTQLDQVCHPSAHMLGSVLQGRAHSPEEGRVLYRLGYLLGRYVYLSDALDDLEEDEQAGGYNPLLLAAPPECAEEAAHETVRQRAQGSLFMTIAEAGAAYELLEVKRFGPILENILYLGLRKNVEQIVIPHGDRPKK